MLAYDLNLRYIAHEHACDSSTVVVTIYKELTIWKAGECFPQDLGSDSRLTTCGLRPKTTTTQFSSTAKQPNVINQADTARNKEKPLNSVPVVELQSMRWLPRERRMEEEAPSWTLGTAYTCQLCGQVFLLLVPWQPMVGNQCLATNGWQPSTFPCLLPSGRPGSGPVL